MKVILHKYLTLCDVRLAAPKLSLEACDGHGIFLLPKMPACQIALSDMHLLNIVPMLKI